MSKTLRATWASFVMVAVISLLLLAPLIVNLSLANFKQDIYHSEIAWGNTFKYAGYQILILTICIAIFIPTFFATPKFIFKKLAKISLAKSLMLSFGIQIAFSSMFYNNGFNTTTFFEQLFKVKNFAGQERSFYPLIIQMIWNTLPSSILMLGPSISRYLSKGIRIKGKRSFWLSTIDYLKSCWSEIVLIYLMMLISSLFFTPVQLFGSEDAAFQYKKETVGLLIFKLLKSGDFSASSKLTIQLAMMAIPIAIMIFFIQWKNSKATQKNIAKNRNEGHVVVSIYSKIVSTILVSATILFMFTPLIISTINGFVYIDYDHYLDGQKGWTNSNFNEVIQNKEFHISFWKTFALSLLTATIALLIVSSYINFAKNKPNIINNIVLTMMFILLILPSSIYVVGTFKILVQFHLSKNIFAFFVLPRVLHVSRLFVLLNMFENKNKNAVAIFDKSRVNLFKRYLNTILENDNLSLLVSIVLLTSIGLSDSYLFNELGYVTTGFENTIVFLTSGFVNPVGEINRQQQSAAIVFVYIESLIILFISMTTIKTIKNIKEK